MNVILETFRAHYIRYLRFYYDALLVLLENIYLIVKMGLKLNQLQRQKNAITPV
jgi:hypothetical protein